MFAEKLHDGVQAVSRLKDGIIEAMGMRVVIVGAGASGLVAAWRAASLGADVLVLEAGGRTGLKIRISGGGRCNVTHAGGVSGVLQGFPRSQGRFLREPLKQFPPEALLARLATAGIPTEAREDGRIFPVSGPGSAHLVADALEELARRAGARIRLGCRVAGLESQDGRLQAVRLEDGSRVEGEVFILATGGASYPQTGTRGEALGWLRQLGLSVKPWRPALAPVTLEVPRPAWEGVALREIRLRLQVQAEGRRLEEAVGDLVFTRHGISGPAALALSEAVEVARREGGTWLSVALDRRPPEALEALFLEAQRDRPALGVRAFMHTWLPERLCPWALEEAGLPLQARMADLPRAARRVLAGLVVALPLGAAGRVNLEKGEVCAGGLSLEGVEAGTGRVKGWANLRVCGELLDVHGAVGGYNLQAAFSTGYVAGASVLGG